MTWHIMILQMDIMEVICDYVAHIFVPCLMTKLDLARKLSFYNKSYYFLVVSLQPEVNINHHPSLKEIILCHYTTFDASIMK